MNAIRSTPQNRRILRQHAAEAMADYSAVMTWLLRDDDGDLAIITEPQGQTDYVGSAAVIDRTGGFHKAHGDGAATDSTGRKYRTQKAYLQDLLGHGEYDRLFNGAGH